MTERLSPHAQVFLDRINAIDYANPPWHEAEVTESMRDQYLLLGEDNLPDFEIVPDLYDAYQQADKLTRDPTRDFMFDLMIAEAAFKPDRMQEAMDVVNRSPAIRAVSDRNIEMHLMSQAKGKLARKAIDHASLTAEVMHQAGFSALTPKATYLAMVCLHELEALEHGLGYYFPTKEKTILVPLQPLEINETHSL